MRLIDADALKKDLTRFYDNEVTAKQLIDEQPTIEPQRIKGRWIQDSYYDEKYVCDKCGEPCATYINGKPRDMFCKWCGADMRGEQNGENS